MREVKYLLFGKTTEDMNKYVVELDIKNFAFCHKEDWEYRTFGTEKNVALIHCGAYDTQSYTLYNDAVVYFKALRTFVEIKIGKTIEIVHPERLNI